MNATPSEELPSEDTHHGTSYYFLNINPLPEKKITDNFKMKKEKAPSEVLTFTQNCPGRNEDEVIDNLPPSKEALSRVKLKKQKEKDLPKDGSEIRRKVDIFCPLSSLVFLIHWTKAKFNSF
jgi:hypothetical protein